MQGPKPWVVTFFARARLHKLRKVFSLGGRGFSPDVKCSLSASFSYPEEPRNHNHARCFLRNSFSLKFMRKTPGGRTSLKMGRSLVEHAAFATQMTAIQQSCSD